MSASVGSRVGLLSVSPLFCHQQEQADCSSSYFFHDASCLPTHADAYTLLPLVLFLLPLSHTRQTEPHA